MINFKLSYNHLMGNAKGGEVWLYSSHISCFSHNQLDLWNPFLFACLLLFAIITTSTPNRHDKHLLIWKCLFRSAGPAACLAVYKPWKSTGITQAHHHLWHYSKTGLNEKSPIGAPGGGGRGRLTDNRLLSPHLHNDVISIIHF